MVLLTIECRYDPSPHDLTIKTNIRKTGSYQMHINSDKTITTLIEMLRYEKEIPRTAGVNLYVHSGRHMVPFSYTMQHEGMQLQARLKELDEELYDDVMHETQKLHIFARLRIHPDL